MRKAKLAALEQLGRDRAAVLDRITSTWDEDDLATFSDLLGRFLDDLTLGDTYTAQLRGRSIERTIVHCGSGVTACHTLLALERAGLFGAKLYVGSWSEWCRRPELPRETSTL